MLLTWFLMTLTVYMCTLKMCGDVSFIEFCITSSSYCRLICSLFAQLENRQSRTLLCKVFQVCIKFK